MSRSYTTDKLKKDLVANPGMRLTRQQMNDLGSTLLVLPVGDPLATLWGAQQHIWLRDNDSDNDRVCAANVSYLLSVGCLPETDESDLSLEGW